MQSDAIVQLSGVHKSYRLGKTEVCAIRGVDLELRTGDFTALVGPSGAGKSTLLNLIGGIDVPDRGSVSINGKDTARLNDDAMSELRSKTTGFVFQSFNLVPVLNVFDNVELPLLLHKDVDAKLRRQRVLEAIEAVELGEFQRHKPDELSGGQRQRVAIARALVTRPALVLADEPTANLDSETAARILDLMTQLNADLRVTFLFSSHDPNIMERADRVVRIQDGKIA